MPDNKRSEENEREKFAKGGRAKFSQRYDPSIKGSVAQRSGERPVLPGYKKNELGKVVPSGQGYPKWAKDNTSTVPNDPANQINRAKGEPQKEAPAVNFSQSPQGPVRTVTDGNTTKYSAESDAALNTLNKAVPSLGNMNRPESGHYPPCLNTRCKSYGKSHPNCLCYSAGSSEMWFAKGGAVCRGQHKEKCQHFADDELARENEAHFNDPSDALDHVAAHHGILHLLTKFGKSRSENPHKPLEDYIDNSRSGHKKIDSHVSNLIDGKLEIEHDKDSREALKSHLSDLQASPMKLLDVGGGIGEMLPMHAAALGAKSANAVNYLNSLRPQRPKTGPLDDPLPPDKLADAKYNRNLDLAQNPGLILKYAKDGTIGPSDLATINTLYPSLAQSLKSKVYAAIVDAKEKGQEIPYKQRMGFSILLGSPLDHTMTPGAMMAIMKANGTNPNQPTQANADQKRASQAELNQIDKTNQLSETPTQTRLSDKKS